MKLNLHPEIESKLMNYYLSKNIPHILFYGDHGSGKKTLVYDFIHLIYGGDRSKVKHNTYFSNCSHSKGIKHIRENLKQYSRSNVTTDGDIYFKCVILFNFENLSVDGQSALRRVIESYSHNTRFFLISHSKERILTPILSRFAQIHVPLPVLNGKPTNIYRYQIDCLFRHHEPLLSPPQPPPPPAATILSSAPHIFANESDDEHVETLKSQLAGFSSETAAPDFLAFAESVVENAYSCVDVMNWMSAVSSMTVEKLTTMRMCFLKVRGEFSHEKLLILYMLHFAFFRSQTGLENISFM